MRLLDALDDPGTVADAVRDARAIVLIPKRGENGDAPEKTIAVTGAAGRTHTIVTSQPGS